MAVELGTYLHGEIFELESQRRTTQCCVGHVSSLNKLHAFCRPQQIFAWRSMLDICEIPVNDKNLEHTRMPSRGWLGGCLAMLTMQVCICCGSCAANRNLHEYIA